MSNFYASYNLAEVTTSVNLISLVCHVTGLGMAAPVRIFLFKNLNENWLIQAARISKVDYQILVDNVFDQIDLLSKWSEGRYISGFFLNLISESRKCK